MFDDFLWSCRKVLSIFTYFKAENEARNIAHLVSQLSCQPTAQIARIHNSKKPLNSCVILTNWTNIDAI